MPLRGTSKDENRGRSPVEPGNVTGAVSPSFSLAPGPLVLRSSKQVGEATSAVSWRWRWPSPDPGFGVGVELGGGQLGGPGDLGRVGEGLPGQGVPAEDSPPRLLQVGASRRPWG